MAETKKILLIGRTGSGKSTLANVLSGTDNFKESASFVSETRKIQKEEFEWKRTKYQVIDTPGIGDTKLTKEEVLDIIAEAVYLVRDGVSQVFFVTNGRFDQYEMATYDLLRTIIFDYHITYHITVVRTNFKDFRKQKKCEDDINSMTRESNDKLKEILESCQGRVIHVDNPPLDIGEEDELNMSKRKRIKSREKLLEYLSKNCQETSYRPEKLARLSAEIAGDYFQYIEKKKELEEELRKLRTSATSFIGVQFPKVERRKNKFKSIFFKNISLKGKKSELVAEKNEELTENDLEDNITEAEISEKIIQLEGKKTKLKKEIQEKEESIRKKLLKHILNNYEGISNELGGNIFLNSVTKDNNDWTIVNQAFADKKLVLKWKSNGFNYRQVQKWAAALGNSFNPEIDVGLCTWLRDDKKLTVEKIQGLGYPRDIEQLRKEYYQKLGREIDILNKHNQQLGQEKDKFIHPARNDSDNKNMVFTCTEGENEEKQQLQPQIQILPK